MKLAQTNGIGVPVSVRRSRAISSFSMSSGQRSLRSSRRSRDQTGLTTLHRIAQHHGVSMTLAQIALTLMSCDA